MRLLTPLARMIGRGHLPKRSECVVELSWRTLPPRQPHQIRPPHDEGTEFARTQVESSRVWFALLLDLILEIEVEVVDGRHAWDRLREDALTRQLLERTEQPTAHQGCTAAPVSVTREVCDRRLDAVAEDAAV